MKDFGLQSHQVVLNYRTVDKSAKLYFVDDPDLPPLEHADQFGDPNHANPVNPEDLLQQARLLLATELGKDPILRRDMRELLKKDGIVSVTPTEKGKVKIDEFHPYYVRVRVALFLRQRPSSNSNICGRNQSSNFWKRRNFCTFWPPKPITSFPFQLNCHQKAFMT
jgi:hypothetical protein